MFTHLKTPNAPKMMLHGDITLFTNELLGNRDSNIMEFLIYLTLGLPNIVISVIQIFAFHSIFEDNFTLSRPPLPLQKKPMLLFLNL